MTIIEDLRYAADNPDVFEHDYPAILRRIADRLEHSGALVPVPDGGACAAGDARGNHTFIMRGGDVFMSEPHLWDWVRIDGTYAELNDDIFVQPVRLVPIAEAEL